MFDLPINFPVSKIKFLATLLTFFLVLSSIGSAAAVTPPRHADGTLTPWAVQLAIMDSKDKGFVHCTGSLVAQQWVLTARHCVDSPVMDEAYADLGANMSYKFPYRIVQVVKHPVYDVALLKLNQPLNATAIELDAAIPSQSSQTIFYGFGGSNVLTKAVLEIVGTSFDGHLFGRSANGTKTVIGDSGGPLVSKGKLVGVLTAAVNIPYESFVPEDYKFVPTGKFSNWLLMTLGLIPTKPNQPQPVPAQPQQNQLPNIQGTVPNQPTITPTPQLPAPNRIAGQNRVQTSLAVWNLGGFITDSVVIATGKKAPDALAAGPLAASMNAPLLLSTGSTIESTIVSAIETRGIKHIYLVGGGLAFDAATQANFLARGISITSLAGANRFETAVLVASTALAKWNLQGRFKTPILLADGLNFPDALSAGATAANLHGIVVLTSGGAMPPATANFIASPVAASQQLITVGGPAHTAWISQPGPVPAVAIVGANRYQTAAMLSANLTPFTTSALVVSGADFPDGLAAAPLAAKRNARLLLTTAAQLPPESVKGMEHLPLRTSSLVIGGQAVISEAVAWALRS